VIGNAVDDPRFTRTAQPFKARLGYRYSGSFDCFEDRLAGVHEQLFARLLQDDRESSLSGSLDLVCELFNVNAVGRQAMRSCGR